MSRDSTVCTVWTVCLECAECLCRVCLLGEDQRPGIRGVSEGKMKACVLAASGGARRAAPVLHFQKVASFFDRE